MKQRNPDIAEFGSPTEFWSPKGSGRHFVADKDLWKTGELYHWIWMSKRSVHGYRHICFSGCVKDGIITVKIACKVKGFFHRKLTSIGIYPYHDNRKLTHYPIITLLSIETTTLLLCGSQMSEIKMHCPVGCPGQQSIDRDSSSSSFDMDTKLILLFRLRTGQGV